MQRKTVLFVESDLDVSTMVLTVAEQFDGVEVVIVPDVQQAETLARDIIPALLLVDEDMPEHAGWEIIHDLNASSETESIPIVVLCSDADTGRQLVAEGAEAYLPKPFSVDDLWSLVQFYTQSVRA